MTDASQVNLLPQLLAHVRAIAPGITLEAERIDNATADLGPLRAKALAGRTAVRERYGAEAFWEQLKVCTDQAFGDRAA